MKPCWQDRDGRPARLITLARLRKRRPLRLRRFAPPKPWYEYAQQLYRHYRARYRHMHGEPYRAIGRVGRRPRIGKRIRAVLESDADALNFYQTPACQTLLRWRFVNSWLQLPIPCGWHETLLRKRREQQLADAIQAPNRQTAARRLRELVQEAGWSRDKLALWLERDVNSLYAGNADPAPVLLYDYDALLAMPVDSTIAFYGPLELLSLFRLGQQNWYFRAYERVGYEWFQPHIMRGALRPTYLLQRWVYRAFVKKRADGFVQSSEQAISESERGA